MSISWLFMPLPKSLLPMRNSLLPLPNHSRLGSAMYTALFIGRSTFSKLGALRYISLIVKKVTTKNYRFE